VLGERGRFFLSSNVLAYGLARGASNAISLLNLIPSFLASPANMIQCSVVKSLEDSPCQLRPR